MRLHGVRLSILVQIYEPSAGWYTAEDRRNSHRQEAEPGGDQWFIVQIPSRTHVPSRYLARRTVLWTYNRNTEERVRRVGISTGPIDNDWEPRCTALPDRNRFPRFFLICSEDTRMTYMIREQTRMTRCSIGNCCPERQRCNQLTVKSGGFDAGLVIDGSISLPFNDGTVASFDIKPEYSLKQIVVS